MGEKPVRVTRGFGYWCWKPQVILQSLRQINEGDILIYADIGCEFVPHKAKSLLEKLQNLTNNDIMGFSLPYKEREWSKNDIFRHFGAENNPKFTESSQIAATIIFMKKSAKTIQIITEWLDIFKNHWNLVDDSPSKTPNHKDFRENRHDQSIWSMINKKYGLKNFDDYYGFSKPDNVEFGILTSRKSWTTMGHILSVNGELQISKTLKISSKILKAWLKIGGKILPSSKARKNCRKLFGLCNV